MHYSLLCSWKGLIDRSAAALHCVLFFYKSIYKLSFVREKRKKKNILKHLSHLRLITIWLCENGVPLQSSGDYI